MPGSFACAPLSRSRPACYVQGLELEPGLLIDFALRQVGGDRRSCWESLEICGGRAAGMEHCGGACMADDKQPIDRLWCYRFAVQDPETHAEVLRRMHAHGRPDRKATVLREDFAGTAADSVAWIEAGPERRAIAVDIDAETVAWARQRASGMLLDRIDRLTFHVADVRAVGPPAVPPADIISVLNFSIGYLRTRSELIAYFKHARSCLSEGGILVMNAHGGGEIERGSEQSSRIVPSPRSKREAVPPPFVFTWEQSPINPVTSEISCRIHFACEGVELRDAFVYRWRHWTLPELLDAAVEAGFGEAKVWRHTFDPSRGAAGVFLGPVESFDGSGTWTAYVVARL